MEKEKLEVFVEEELATATRQIADALGDLAEASDDMTRKTAYREAQLAVLQRTREHLKKIAQLTVLRP